LAGGAPVVAFTRGVLTGRDARALSGAGTGPVIDGVEIGISGLDVGEAFAALFLTAAF
jgi:hypothetical protein